MDKINVCQCASIQAICTIHKSDKQRKLEMHRERQENALSDNFQVDKQLIQEFFSISGAKESPLSREEFANIFYRIYKEAYKYCDATLEVFEDLKKYPQNKINRGSK